MIPENVYPIGFMYMKDGVKYTIVDHLTTRNSKGEIVRFRYVCSHDFLGQSVIDVDVAHTTIARLAWYAMQ